MATKSKSPEAEIQTRETDSEAVETNDALEAGEEAEASADAPENDAAEDDNVNVIVRRKELIQRVAKRAGMRPNQVRAAVEATLNELGKALVAGESINVPAIGRLGVKRHKETSNADVLMVRLRRKKARETEPETLADPTE